MTNTIRIGKMKMSQTGANWDNGTNALWIRQVATEKHDKRRNQINQIKGIKIGLMKIKKMILFL